MVSSCISWSKCDSRDQSVGSRVKTTVSADISAKMKYEKYITQLYISESVSNKHTDYF